MEHGITSVQVSIATTSDHTPVEDMDEARRAVSKATGERYEGGLEDLGDGCWLIDLPAAAAAELMDCGAWSRAGGGYSVEAEWI